MNINLLILVTLLTCSVSLKIQKINDLNTDELLISTLHDYEQIENEGSLGYPVSKSSESHERPLQGNRGVKTNDNSYNTDSAFTKDVTIKMRKKRIGVYSDIPSLVNSARLANVTKLFSKNGAYVVNLISNFSNTYDGYVFPGGSSNISDRTTPYWSFVNSAVSTGKPVFGICLGFQHIVKKFFPVIKQTRCNMRSKLIDGKFHNHEWCVRGSRKYVDILSSMFKLGKYSYHGLFYVGALESKDKKYYGLVSHPEAQTNLTLLDNYLINSFLGSL